jgi:hypothetical protein
VPCKGWALEKAGCSETGESVRRRWLKNVDVTESRDGGRYTWRRRWLRAMIVVRHK